MGDFIEDEQSAAVHSQQAEETPILADTVLNESENDSNRNNESQNVQIPPIPKRKPVVGGKRKRVRKQINDEDINKEDMRKKPKKTGKSTKSDSNASRPPGPPTSREKKLKNEKKVTKQCKKK